MAIKIHHGPPGSYKTAGAVADDFIPAAKEGRLVVTNVRGLSRESVLNEFSDLPDTFDIIHVDTTVSEGREKLSRWFHWVPRGAFLLIDEAQLVWPKSWRQSDLDALDYPGGVDQASKDGRPSGWAIAWEMHRHYNWDFVLTTPNIKKIRDDIRLCAETAYKHKNLAIVGVGGRYLEGYHLADDDGSNNSQLLSLNHKKVPSPIFKIYESTATGQVSDSKAGLSFLKNPRVLLVMGIFFCAVVFSSYLGTPSIISGKSPKLSSSNSDGNQVSASQRSKGGEVHSSSSRLGLVPDVSVRQSSEVPADIKAGPFSGAMAKIQAGLKRSDGTYKYLLDINGQTVSDAELLDAGYYVKPMGYCLVMLSYRGQESHVKCGSSVDSLSRRQGRV